MCILAGCDFLKAPQNIGMKKAHLNIRKYRSFTKVPLASNQSLTHCLAALKLLPRLAIRVFRIEIEDNLEVQALSIASKGLGL